MKCHLIRGFGCRPLESIIDWAVPRVRAEFRQQQVTLVERGNEGQQSAKHHLVLPLPA